MTDDRATAVLERVAASQPRTAAETLPEPIDADGAPIRRTQGTERDSIGEPQAHGPRRWNDPEEKLMLWGVLFFLGLGLYAGAFVAFGMWLTP